MLVALLVHTVHARGQQLPTYKEPTPGADKRSKNNPKTNQTVRSDYRVPSLPPPQALLAERLSPPDMQESSSYQQRSDSRNWQEEKTLYETNKAVRTDCRVLSLPQPQAAPQAQPQTAPSRQQPSRCSHQTGAAAAASEARHLHKQDMHMPV